ncbi:hypothetical protein LA5095_05841 [Roseibium album]|uniref:Uncharacterized protein n=1 Tax=Roseibium album TaxID=311410 RepID=A0A0M6ZK18_9HYPH|nr:hypothetical protein LA5094_05916 [Roseibium album]CTQ69244.1 hypothetical protein LA5096_02067 [Roseibium album]CTQ80600.1 hypothetical protein LA5095_05841 [Roseibium album]
MGSRGVITKKLLCFPGRIRAKPITKICIAVIGQQLTAHVFVKNY